MNKPVACAVLAVALLVPASGAAADDPLPAGVELCRPHNAEVPVPGVIVWTDLDGDGQREQGSIHCLT